MPSTLLSWQFLGAPHGSCGKRQAGVTNPREEGGREMLLQEPHSALCFQETKVLERKDNQAKLLFSGTFGIQDVLD